VIRGAIKSQIDAIWQAYWLGGIFNPPRSHRADSLPPVRQTVRQAAYRAQKDAPDQMMLSMAQPWRRRLSIGIREYLSGPYGAKNDIRPEVSLKDKR
jgi:hypothetical protein